MHVYIARICSGMDNIAGAILSMPEHILSMDQVTDYTCTHPCRGVAWLIAIARRGKPCKLVYRRFTCTWMVYYSDSHCKLSHTETYARL